MLASVCGSAYFNIPVKISDTHVCCCASSGESCACATVEGACCSADEPASHSEVLVFCGITTSTGDAGAEKWLISQFNPMCTSITSSLTWSLNVTENLDDDLTKNQWVFDKKIDEPPRIIT